MQVPRFAGLMLVLVLAFATTDAVGGAAAPPFNGEDAAYIDWSVKNCGAKSTDKEHGLVDAAKAKGRDAFYAAYVKSYGNTSIAQADADRAKKDALCATLKDRYGPSGTKFSDLLTWVGAPAAAVPGTPKAGAKGSGGGKGRGRRSKGEASPSTP